MILPGCTRGHIRARYVLQGYLIRNLMFGQRWAFLLAIGGPFFFSGGLADTMKESIVSSRGSS